MLPCLGKVMGAENRVEDKANEGNRSLGTVFQRIVRQTVRVRSLADLETPDSFVNLVRVFNWGFDGRA